MFDQTFFQQQQHENKATPPGTAGQSSTMMTQPTSNMPHPTTSTGPSPSSSTPVTPPQTWSTPQQPLTGTWSSAPQQPPTWSTTCPSTSTWSTTTTSPSMNTSHQQPITSTPAAAACYPCSTSQYQPPQQQSYDPFQQVEYLQQQINYHQNHVLYYTNTLNTILGVFNDTTNTKDTENNPEDSTPPPSSPPPAKKRKIRKVRILDAIISDLKLGGMFDFKYKLILSFMKAWFKKHPEIETEWKTKGSKEEEKSQKTFYRNLYQTDSSVTELRDIIQIVLSSFDGMVTSLNIPEHILSFQKENDYFNSAKEKLNDDEKFDEFCKSNIESLKKYKLYLISTIVEWLFENIKTIDSASTIVNHSEFSSLTWKCLNITE